MPLEHSRARCPHPTHWIPLQYERIQSPVKCSKLNRGPDDVRTSIGANVSIRRQQITALSNETRFDSIRARSRTRSLDHTSRDNWHVLYPHVLCRPASTIQCPVTKFASSLWICDRCSARCFASSYNLKLRHSFSVRQTDMRIA